MGGTINGAVCALIGDGRLDIVYKYSGRDKTSWMQ